MIIHKLKRLKEREKKRQILERKRKIVTKKTPKVNFNAKIKSKQKQSVNLRDFDFINRQQQTNTQQEAKVENQFDVSGIFVLN